MPTPDQFADALRRIYDRRQPPIPWRDGENLPWNDPGFGERMLREHLDQSHGAASRRLPEIRALVQHMTAWLRLQPGAHLLDITCGPGLYAAEFARQGQRVTGVDFNPASVAYARRHCAGLDCTIIESDVRAFDFPAESFDAAIYIYGQPTVLRPAEMEDVFRRIRVTLRPGARFLIEILDFDRFNEKDANWWYTDRGGLWGDFPFLHLGERRYDAEQQASIERFYVINLDTGELQEYGLSDQTYTAAQIEEIMRRAGFTLVETHPAWDDLALKDAAEWVVYVAEAA
jgi:SAM-dependent methyltransferase